MGEGLETTQQNVEKASGVGMGWEGDRPFPTRGDTCGREVTPRPLRLAMGWIQTQLGSLTLHVGLEGEGAGPAKSWLMIGWIRTQLEPLTLHVPLRRGAGPAKSPVPRSQGHPIHSLKVPGFPWGWGCGTCVLPVPRSR